MSPLEDNVLPYSKLASNLKTVRSVRKAPLTLGEKIVYRFFFFSFFLFFFSFLFSFKKKMSVFFFLFSLFSFLYFFFSKKMEVFFIHFCSKKKNETFFPFSHLDVPETAGDILRGGSYLKLRPDRVAMQDATAQVPFF